MFESFPSFEINVVLKNKLLKRSDTKCGFVFSTCVQKHEKSNTILTTYRFPGACRL